MYTHKMKPQTMASMTPTLKLYLLYVLMVWNEKVLTLLLVEVEEKRGEEREENEHKLVHANFRL